MTKPITGSRGQVLGWKYFPIGGAYIEAESNSCELLKIVHTVISDERTKNKVFSVVIYKSSSAN